MAERTIDRVLAIAKSQGLNKTQFAKRMEVDPQTITNWKARGMPGRAVARAADVLGVSADILLGRDHLANVTMQPPMRYAVPEISWVSAGRFDDANDPYPPGEGSRMVPTDVPVSQTAFALIVRGDSMEPDFPEGCTIIVDPAARPEPGSFVVVRAQDWDEATFKKYSVDAGIKWLVPLNPQYPAIQMPVNSVMCGVVVEMIPVRKRFR